MTHEPNSCMIPESRLGGAYGHDAYDVRGAGGVTWDDSLSSSVSASASSLSSISSATTERHLNRRRGGKSRKTKRSAHRNAYLAFHGSAFMEGTGAPLNAAKKFVSRHGVKNKRQTVYVITLRHVPDKAKGTFHRVYRLYTYRAEKKELTSSEKKKLAESGLRDRGFKYRSSAKSSGTPVQLKTASSMHDAMLEAKKLRHSGSHAKKSSHRKTKH